MDSRRAEFGWGLLCIGGYDNAGEQQGKFLEEHDVQHDWLLIRNQCGSWYWSTVVSGFFYEILFATADSLIIW